MNPKCLSVANTDSMVESNTVHSKMSSKIGGTSKVSDIRPTSVESNKPSTNTLNSDGSHNVKVNYEKMDDIDNNNDKFIKHDGQEG